MSKQRLRPSQIITTFGPGSIVDLPDDSVMIAGIEHWFSEGHKPHRKISEPRLQAILKVNEGFRTPPVGSFNENDVPFVRFPRWRVCPKCSRLSNQFPEDKKNPELAPRCFSCKAPTYPARVVVACAKGHIDDFPWYWWVHRGNNCGGGHLSLKGEGRSAALGDLRVECNCGVPSRSLSGALGKEAMARLACQGKRPWLDDEKEECTEKELHALQRGASNIYFSVVRSALSIPPWTNQLLLEVNSWWHTLKPEYRPKEAEWPIHITPRFGPDKVAEVTEYLKKILSLTSENRSIRKEEYDALTHADEISEEEYFHAVRRDVSQRVDTYISDVAAIPRLREVRALLGFTRIQAPEMDPTMELFDEEPGIPVTPAPLSAKQLDWLPAIENLGEGVFLRLNPQRLRDWENQDVVKRRASNLLDAYSLWRQKRGLQALKSQRPRLILLHTLAHLLMRQMSLDCGYSSASLRERIYSDENMAGLLIYTSTPDSDGSLGGLVRQTRLVKNSDGSERDNFGRLLIDIIELVRTCSSDPLCREHDPRRTARLNGAACHACAMVSETSCEFGNRLLDRGMVVNLPNDKPTGYFNYDE